MSYTAEALIDRYVSLRDEVKEISERHTQELAGHRQSMEVLETALQDMLNQIGGDNIKTKAGTAFRSTATTAKVDDWPAFITFVQQSGDTELLVRNVNKTRLTECLEAGRAVPGTSVSSVSRINVRRA